MDAEPGAGRRAALRDEAEAARRRLAALTGQFDDIVDAARDANVDDEHDPEGSTIAFERSQVQSLADQARRRIAAAEAAVARLDAGTYEVCEACGGPIGDERLAARPTATRCMACA